MLEWAPHKAPETHTHNRQRQRHHALPFRLLICAPIDNVLVWLSIPVTPAILLLASVCDAAILGQIMML